MLAPFGADGDIFPKETLVAEKKTAAKKAPAKKAAVKTVGEKAPAAPKKAAPKKAAAKKAVAKMASQEPTKAQIAELAHKYWVERGGHHGSHHDDWLRAERELKGL